MKFITKTKTLVPSTFEHLQHNDGWTWMHPTGKTRRLDYVGIDYKWAHAITDSFVDTDIIIDIPQASKRRKTEKTSAPAREDHRVASVQLKFVVKQPHSKKVKKKVVFCRHALRNEEVRELARKIIAELPLPPWQLDIDSHVFFLVAQIHSILSDVAPPLMAPKRQTFISDATFNMDLEASELRKNTNRSHRFHKQIVVNNRV